MSNGVLYITLPWIAILEIVELLKRLIQDNHFSKITFHICHVTKYVEHAHGMGKVGIIVCHCLDKIQPPILDSL